MYLLSDLTLTNSKIDYVLDLIKVYFSTESVSLPQMQVGVRRRTGSQSKVVTLDVLSSDVSNFISLMSSQGINISLISITSDGPQYLINLRYEGEDINFTLS